MVHDLYIPLLHMKKLYWSMLDVHVRLVTELILITLIVKIVAHGVEYERKVLLQYN